jgi:hypothetical protein
MDMDELVAVWKTYLARRQWEGKREAAVANGDAVAVAEAERALAALPDVTALEALRANADLVNMLSVQRWIALTAAREQGATLEQIGQALRMSRQSAWETFQRKMAERDLRGGGGNDGTGGAE